MFTKVLIVSSFLTIVGASVENVLNLNDSTFHEQLAVHPKIMVKFMIPWCHYCQSLQPIFEEIAEELFYNSSSIRLAEVNCKHNNETCHLYDIGSYPTIILFKNGIEFSTYEGALTREGLLVYMEHEFRKPYTYIDTIEDFETLKQNNRVLVVGYFKNTSTLRLLFEHYADKMKDKYEFAVIDNATLFGYVEEFLELFRPMYLRNSFETHSVILKNVKINSKIFEHFIDINKHGLVGIKDDSNSHEFAQPLFVLFYNIDFDLNAKKTNYYRNRLLKIAVNYLEYNFAISHFDFIENDIDVNDINMTRSCIFTQVNEKSVMDKDFTMANIVEFINQYKNGKLTRRLRSDPIPEKSSDKVKVAVGLTFNEMIYQNINDTFLVFVQEDCFYCRELAPVLEELATLLFEENIEVVKIDVKSNDVPAIFEIQAYPTLVWLPRDDKTDLEYYLQTDTSLESLLAFVAERATVELKHYDRHGRIRKINKKAKVEL